MRACNGYCRCALVAAIAVPSRERAAQAWVPCPGRRRRCRSPFRIMNVKKHLAGTTVESTPGPDRHSRSMLVDFTVRGDRQDRRRCGAAARHRRSTRALCRIPETNIDDGQYHSARLPTSDSRCAITSRARGTVIHAVRRLGRPQPRLRLLRALPRRDSGLNEVQVGAYAAKLFEGACRGCSSPAATAYGFVEKVVNVLAQPQPRRPRGRVFLQPTIPRLQHGQAGYTHGGIDFPKTGGIAALPPE